MTLHTKLTFVILDCSAVRFVDRDDFAHVLHHKCSCIDGSVGPQTEASVSCPENLQIVLYTPGRERQIGTLFARFTES